MGIINLRQDDPAFSYGFKYQPGSIVSKVNVTHIEGNYKEDYIRSLIRLIDFVFTNLVNESEQSPGSQMEANKTEEISL